MDSLVASIRIRFLLRQLKHRKPRIRARAAARIADKPSSAIPHTATICSIILTENDPDVRLILVESLGTLVSGAVLMMCVIRSEAAVCRWALKSGCECLHRCNTDPNPKIRESAARAMDKVIGMAAKFGFLDSPEADSFRQFMKGIE